MDKNPITVETVIDAPISKVWEYWNEPKHIMGWAFASDDWEAPSAENDLREGGKFTIKMAAKVERSSSSNKSASFDFTGTYTKLVPHQLIEYDMDKSPSDDTNRHVKIEFEETPEGVKVTETFDPEDENSEELQRSGWQSILDNFKKYVLNN